MKELKQLAWDHLETFGNKEFCLDDFDCILPEPKLKSRRDIANYLSGWTRYNPKIVSVGKKYSKHGKTQITIFQRVKKEEVYMGDVLANLKEFAPDWFGFTMPKGEENANA